MLHRYLIALLTLLALGSAAATPTRADAIQLLSRSQLSPGGVTTDYPNLPAGVAAATVTPPLLVATAGVNVTFATSVTAAAGGRLLRVNQGVGFLGDFPTAGTELLVTENGSGVPSGPLTISFSIPVLEFGLDAQNTFFESGATSTFTFSIFDGSLLLGTFTRSGADDSGTFFLGARAILGQRITQIIISGASTVDAPGAPGSPDTRAQNNFAIGPVQFQPVPEPATMVLLGTGLAAVAVARRRKGQQAKPE